MNSNPSSKSSKKSKSSPNKTLEATPQVTIEAGSEKASTTLAKEGITLFKAENYEEALFKFEEALRIEPRNITFLTNKASTLVKLHRFLEAITEFNIITKAEPQNITAWNGLGEAHISLGHYQEAASCFGQTLEIKPTDHYALNGKGSALTHAKVYQEAAECFKKIDGKFPQAWMLKGLSFYKTNNFKESAEAYSKVPNTDKEYSKALANQAAALFKLADNQSTAARKATYEQALTAVNNSLVINEKNISALKTKGNIHLALEDYNNALGCFTKLTDDLNEQTADILLNKGYCLYHLSQPLEAIKCFDNVSRGSEEFNAALLHKAVALLQLTKIPGATDADTSLNHAIEALDQVTKNTPDNAKAWEIKGEVFATQGNHAKAIECFIEVIGNIAEGIKGLNPDDTSAWNNIAASYFKIGKYSQALDHFKKLLELEGNKPTELTLTNTITTYHALIQSPGIEDKKTLAVEALQLLDKAMATYNNDALFTATKIAILTEIQDVNAAAKLFADGATHDDSLALDLYGDTELLGQDFTAQQAISDLA